jgi:hypothetical protein
MTNLMIVPDFKHETAGVVTWWKLSGGLNLDALTKAWSDYGLDPALLPEIPSGEVALRRAMNEQAEKRILVRPLTEGKLALVQEDVDGDNLSTSTLLVASVSKLGTLKVENKAGLHQPTASRVDKLKADFEFFSENITQQDVSGWLCKVMKNLQAVSLRESGGIYFVPTFAMAQFTAVVSALHDASAHTVHQIPAIPTAEALDAITSAITEEAEKAVAAIEADLQGGNLGKRALETRTNLANDVEQKLAAYENLLNSRNDGLHKKLEDLRYNVSLAVMRVEAEAAE